MKAMPRSEHKRKERICVTKQPETDGIKFSRSNVAYCVATLVVVSSYRVVEPWYLLYCGIKKYRELNGTDTVKNCTAVLR